MTLRQSTLDVCALMHTATRFRFHPPEVILNQRSGPGFQGRKEGPSPAATPAIVEQASRPVEKIGEIRAINVTGAGQGTDGGNNSVGSFLASSSSLPMIREFLRFLTEVEAPERKSSSQAAGK